MQLLPLIRILIDIIDKSKELKRIYKLVKLSLLLFLEIGLVSTLMTGEEQFGWGGTTLVWIIFIYIIVKVNGMA